MDGMMDSSYSNAPVTAPDQPPADKSPKESVDEQNAGAAQILVAKKELPPGTKEGDTCTFTVQKDFGDEFSLEYVKEGQEEATEQPTRDNMDTTTANEISALDQKGNQ
jgi:hypothetical protein